MKSNHKIGKEREMPKTHLYLIGSPIFFIIVWFLDSNVIQLSTFLNNFIPLIIRIIFFIIILIIALSFVYISHKTLFHSHEPPDHLILTGIFRFVRNPMYSGILLLYVALIFLSISLISIGIFVLIFIIYNKMVNFEENILENDFGNDYRRYKERVPKWIPNPFRKLNY
jgi:protein-S-isoprenylcysteine O-methyltransferase Ste14